MIELLGGRRGGSTRGLRLYTNLASANLDFRKVKKGVWHDRHHDSFATLGGYGKAFINENDLLARVHIIFTGMTNQ